MDTKPTTDKMVFAAIDKTYEKLIPSPKESEAGGKNYITWGDNNQYPEYLYGLYLDTVDLRSIIDRTAEFVAGNEVVCNIEGFSSEANKRGDTFAEIIRLAARDYKLYGGYALQIVRRKDGKIGEIYYIDFRYLRCSKKRDIFWYSEEYAKRYQRANKTVVYPKFVPEAVDIPTSILYVTNDKSNTYPTPQYSGALKACEIERHLDEFSLSSIMNGLFPGLLINFNSGIPDDNQKAEIEKNMQEKWGGSSNVGRVMLSFADDKDNQTIIQKIDIADYGDKYKTAAERSKDQIFGAFGAIPQIFGQVRGTATGFSEQEFQEAFRLYNRTAVRPLQTIITDNFDKIFSVKGSVSITPYSLDENKDETVVE